MVYRITEEEVRASQVEYKKNYKPWRPFTFTSELATGVYKRIANLVTTQNGQDTDDYAVHEGNKVEKYLSAYSEGSKVLLLGVGTGREVLAAKGIGFNAVGTTLGSRNTDYAHNYLGLGPDEVLECLNEKLPFTANSFDVVAGFQIFEHTIAPLLFLLEQRRVLKFGGKLLLEWPPAKDYTMGDNPHHQVCFTPGQARDLFLKAGFDSVKLYYDDMYPVPDEDLWRGDQDKMLVVEGIKGNCGKDYVQRAESLV